MGLRRAAAAFLLLISGCAEWPRLANIPQDTSLDESPREVVTVEWAAAVTETGENDQPWLAEQQFALEPQTGAVIDGSLDGFLWGEGALPEVDSRWVFGFQIISHGGFLDSLWMYWIHAELLDS